MSNVVIRVGNLSKRYRIGQYVGGQYQHRTLRDVLADAMHAPFRRLQARSKQRVVGSTPTAMAHQASADSIWALKDVSFEVKQGEVVGIIGRNGAGKTTLLKLLSRITEPTGGRAMIKGRIGSLLGVGTGFHAELTGRENIYLSGAILGMTKKEVDRKFDEIVIFSGVEKFIDTPVKRYSSGMLVRLGFAVAAHLEPEILLVDEVLAVGDAQFQKKCLGKMRDVVGEGRTVLFVSHNMRAVQKLCQRAILLNEGKLIVDGQTEEVIAAYLQSEFTVPPERTWRGSGRPGDGIAFLNVVRVRDISGNTVDTIDVRETVGIEIEYSILAVNRWPAVVVHFFNDEGVHLFGSHDLSYKQSDSMPSSPCVVREVCWIPSNLLNEGHVIVNVFICDFTPVQIKHAVALEVVAFEAVDRRDISYEVVTSHNRWPGAVRPILKWDVEVIGDKIVR